MAADRTNPLSRGFYTVPDAARLIEVGSAARIRGWLSGYRQHGTGPLLQRDYAPIEGKQELSFLDLMEVRFVEHFRANGVKVRTLRAALEHARAVFNEDKPLLRRDILFLPTEDRKHLLVEEVMKRAATENDDRRLWNLVSKQYQFGEIVERTLARGLAFDPDTQLTSKWTPRPDRFPKIVVDPRVAYGQPSTPGRIATGSIFASWEAEGEEAPVVADWFNLPVGEVQMAVDFERSLIAERQALAA